MKSEPGYKRRAQTAEERTRSAGFDVGTIGLLVVPHCGGSSRSPPAPILGSTGRRIRVGPCPRYLPSTRPDTTPFGAGFNAFSHGQFEAVGGAHGSVIRYACTSALCRTCFCRTQGVPRLAGSLMKLGPACPLALPAPLIGSGSSASGAVRVSTGVLSGSGSRTRALALLLTNG